MVDWNPNEPSRLGMEFLVRSGATSPSIRVDSLNKAAALRVDSTSTQTIDEIGVLVSPDTANSVILAEVLQDGAVEQEVETTRVDPNEAVLIGGGVSPSGSAAIVAILAQDPVNVANFVSQAVYSSDAFSLRFGTTGLFTGRRIVGLRLYIAGRDASPEPTAFPLRVVWAGKYWRNFDTTAFQPGGAVGRFVMDTGEMNPLTGQPWTVAEVEEFDGPSAIELDVFPIPTDDPTVVFHWLQAYMEVDHVPENRLARDVVQMGAAERRWLFYEPSKPNAAANMAKANGGDMTLLLRQPRYGNIPNSPSGSALRFSVPYIEAVQDHSAVGMFDYPDLVLDHSGVVTTLGDPAKRRLLGFEMKHSGIQDPDGQAFATLLRLLVDPALPNQMNQKMTPSASASYDGILVPLQYEDNGAGVEDLVIDVRRESDNVLMGSATISTALADEFPPDPVAGWRLVSAVFDAPVALVSGTQYKVGFVPPDAGSWYFGALWTTTPGSFVEGAPTYDGTTDFGDYGGGDSGRRDFSVLLYNAPDAVDSIQVTAETVEVTPATPRCGISGLPWIHVAWEADAVIPNFAYFEIQRADAWTPWYTVARITDIDGSGLDLDRGFQDHEARVNMYSAYRVRVVDTFGAASPWSAEDNATLVSPDRGYWFSNNALPERSVAYGDIYDSSPAVRSFQFPETGEVVLRTVYGRDGHVAFIPAERRGVTFQRRLLISGLVTPVPAAPYPAGPLVVLSRAAVNYVCVRDEHGGRWFANVKVPNYDDRNPGRFEYVDIDVAELTVVPDPVDAVY